MALNVYEIINERILTMLKNDIVPWHRPWSGGGMPINLISKKEYRGVNILLLGTQGYSSRIWCSYKQCASLGGQVRKGEKSTPVLFWKIYDSKTNPLEKVFVSKSYNAFNTDQCDGLELPKSEEEPREFTPIQACENLIRLYKTIPPIEHGGTRAFYAPTFDKIGMPPKESFHSPEEYYSTLFHELTHSTGHGERLNRDGITNPIQFASHSYSFEELIAECGAAFLCGKAGIENKTLDNSVAYIQSWMKKLKSEPKWIVEAASKAMKAADYIQGITFKKEEEVV